MGQDEPNTGLWLVTDEGYHDCSGLPAVSHISLYAT